MLPNKKGLKVPVYNNCPYAAEEVLKLVRQLREAEERRRRVRIYNASLYNALRLRIKSEQELDEHRRQGHPRYPPDCPECKRGVARRRPHTRADARSGGELSVDIGGPHIPGLPVTDPIVAKHQWHQHMLVGAFMPFSEKEVQVRYEREGG